MMTKFKLIAKSIIHYRRSNALLFLGSALSCMLITGALILGDSVNYSLNTISQTRIGKIQFMIQGGSTFFRSSLHQSINHALECDTAAIIHLPAIASSQGGQKRSNASQLIGVDHTFFNLSPTGDPFTIKPGTVILNEKSAKKLNVSVNDKITVSVKNPSGLPSDAPFSTGHELITLRLTVDKIISKHHFGDFSLKINPQVPPNIFINLNFLAEKLNRQERANVILVAQNESNTITVDQVQRVLEQYWQLDDTTLTLEQLPNQSLIELSSSDVFLPTLITNKLLKAFPKSTAVFTYFVNSLDHGKLSTPYSMVSAYSSSSLNKLKANEISISQWLAKDLNLNINDSLELSYYTITPTRQLETNTSTFKVSTIYSLSSLINGKTLMPDFPGLSDVGNCRDWQPGIPIDLEKIRDKDEDYWDRFRGMPKALINLSSAQLLWSNQFGNLTALRFNSSDLSATKQTINDLIQARDFGITTIDIKSQSLQSAEESIDFSELFLGLSFFMVIASLTLLALFFSYYIDSRRSDINTLQALGYTQPLIRKLFFSEGLVIACFGSLVGLLLSMLYNHGLLIGLTTIWFNAVRTTELTMHLKPITLLIGFITNIIFASASMYYSLSRFFKFSVAQPIPISRIQKAAPLIKYLNSGLFLIIAILIFHLLSSKSTLSILFFVCLGILLLGNGLLLAFITLTNLAHKDPKSNLSIWSIGLNNIHRRIKVSLGLITVLACGLFMIIAVSANRQNESSNAMNRSSGTGGYSLFAESTYPLTHNLNTIKGRNFYGLDEHLLQDTQFVQMRLQPGNDASCLNINRTLTPAILGLNPESFISKQSFTFTNILKNYKDQVNHPWQLLQSPAEGQIPAIADQTVIQYGLGKKVGESIWVTNDQGQPIELLLIASLANSIFQGHVLISENNFLKHFSSNEGYQLFLVDQSSTSKELIQKELSRALIKYGVEITDTATRLAEFNSVQNTYLSIFLVLGGMGLMISTLGLAILLARHILERRGELALLAAIGYTKKMIKKLILAEYMVLLLAGIIIGTVSGLVAVLPVITVPGTQVPLALIVIILLAITFTGVASIEIVTNHLLNKNLIQSLRNE